MESDCQELKSTHMEWNDGEIVIIELSSSDSYVKHLRRYEPDESFGPSSAAGGALPAGLNDTPKVEIGFSRRWSDNPGLLDWKANEWATFPGVRYILCVAVKKNLASATYKLTQWSSRDTDSPFKTPSLWLPRTRC
ncbi:hypothetical protein KRP22_011949 [Phytophthora ramorum]|nr:hypothetical protein KRP22_11787 [Phytophthora ramorum]